MSTSVFLSVNNAIHNSPTGTQPVADTRGAVCGFNPSPPPLRKKSSSYLGVSFWFGDILSEKQYPICLRLHQKAFGNQKFLQAGPFDPLFLQLNIYFFQIVTPPPPQWKARSASASGHLTLKQCWPKVTPIVCDADIDQHWFSISFFLDSFQISQIMCAAKTKGCEETRELVRKRDKLNVMGG